MRTRMVASALLAAAGCICWNDPIACVRVRTATAESPEYREYCVDVGHLECVQLLGDPSASDPPSAPDPCPGSSRFGASCEDLGFTTACSGDYFVRPGESC